MMHTEDDSAPVTPQAKAAVASMTTIDEDDAYGVITGCFEYIDALTKFRAADIAIDPQSVLGKADSSMPPYLASHHAQRAIMGATDHLFTLASAMDTRSGGNQTTYGPFTLVRGALESIGQGMYVLGRTRQREMLYRTLRLEASDDGFAKQFGTYINSEKRAEGRTKGIKASTLRHGFSWSDIKRPLGFKDVITTGGGDYGFVDNMLIFWMLTSGVAHNKPWAVVSLTDRVEIPGTRDSIGATYTLTSNTTYIAAALQTACIATDMLINSYANKSQRRPDPKRLLLYQAIIKMMRYCDRHRRPLEERLAKMESAPNP